MHLGSFLFGAAWGLAGFCPVSALFAIGAGYKKAFIFVIAIKVGMYIYDHLFKVCKKIEPNRRNKKSCNPR
jgi:uncharacterized membrane protein YedE/YeeE